MGIDRGTVKRAETPEQALAQLRTWFDGTGPILTIGYALQLVELIETERTSWREAAELKAAAAHALKVLHRETAGFFIADDAEAADEAAAILEEVLDDQ